MGCCRECISYKPKTSDEGDCRINGDVPADRDSDRCPSRTFVKKPSK
ncbi:MAG: hypothetical protein OS112_08470 [Methanoregula sp.]|nr:MAG: hypothetical protein OS112_08470 [Methanoregula sp.]